MLLLLQRSVILFRFCTGFSAGFVSLFGYPVQESYYKAEAQSN